MRRHVSDIAFTPAVKAMQERLGSRPAYARMEEKGGWRDRVTPELTQFLAERDSFYLATASADGFGVIPNASVRAHSRKLAQNSCYLLS